MKTNISHAKLIKTVHKVNVIFSGLMDSIYHKDYEKEPIRALRFLSDYIIDIIERPNLTRVERHLEYVKEQIKEGHTYSFGGGPRLISYADLPFETRLVDTLNTTVIKGLMGYINIENILKYDPSYIEIIKDMSLKKGSLDVICAAVHGINQIYAEALGDVSRKDWEEESDNAKKSVKNGVLEIIHTPDISIKKLHENWMKYKIGLGWNYGVIKDVDKKTHPNLISYHLLPPEEQAKFDIFSLTVRGCLGYGV